MKKTKKTLPEFIIPQRPLLMEMNVDNVIMEGEAVILDKQGKSQYQQLQKALLFKEDTQIKIFLFDLLFLDGKDLRALPLIERKETLQKLIPDIHPRLRVDVRDI